jgi:hypothetical protein
MINDNELGPQPLEGVMIRLALSNGDLVKASTRQLTHKMVQKGRRGRRLTLNVQEKILEALRQIHPEGQYKLQDLFNY